MQQEQQDMQQARCKAWIEQRFKHRRPAISQIVADAIQRFSLDKSIVERIIAETLYEGSIA